MRVSACFLFLAACAAEGDSGTRAADIQYDNASTGLMSTTVQEALDDVIAMARATEEKVDQPAQPDRPAVIECKFQTANLQLTSMQVMPHVFTSLECGGTLPGPEYSGAISKFETCGYWVSSVQVMSAGEPDGPGVTLRGNVTCNGPAKFVVLFHKVRS
ncbi:MAG: hypothetical protein H0T46_18685 [Deltaproteobacteria bacterium]|nr:hypothetical protein [Deltaproteobacteria bacterium]